MYPLRSRKRPETSELVSLLERVRSLGFLRISIAVTALTAAAATSGEGSPPWRWVAIATVAYLPVLATPWTTKHLRRRPALLLIGLTMLVDGAYLAWVTYATGGLDSPLRFLIYVHVVGVTLLASSRTGLKVAAWHSLLLFVTSYAQAAGIVRVTQTILPGGSTGDFQLATTLAVGAIVGVALATGAFSSLMERELRAQKLDLEQLSSMMGELARADDASDVSRILVEEVCACFGFTRGVVLASPAGELEVLARSTEEPFDDPGTRLDAVVERAWETRGTQAVRALDPDADPRLAALLPDARNLLVVPLLVDGGHRVGVLAVEYRRASDGVKRWVVAMVEQFSAHAAMAMRNVWLSGEIREKLEENRALRRQLIADNFALESRGHERTEELQQTIEELRFVDDQRRGLLSRLVSAEEEARQRIAGDLHDDPVQKLVAASMHLQMLNDDLEDPEQLESVEKVLSIVTACIMSLRHMLFELHPTELDHVGLAAALRLHVATLDGDLGIEIDDHFSREPDRSTRVVLYRIAQEALANVHKHAQASKVEISLDEQDDGFRVRISDDGVGFSAPELPLGRPGHLGLGAMRERATMAGGWCNLFSLPEGGTTVEYWIPADALSVSGEAEELRPKDGGVLRGTAAPDDPQDWARAS
jgi:signal transduction histidine kinase